MNATYSVGVDYMDSTAILLIYCPDRKGLVAAVSNFVFRHNGNILQADQHPDKKRGLFLMRAEWELKDFDLDVPSFALQFAPIAESHQMQWHLEYSSGRQRVAIFVSQYDHCLADLLYRNRSGELDCEISLIIGNHPHAQQLADAYAIPFHYIPVNPDTKAEVERRQIALLEEHHIDVIVLARYMQILSAEFVDHYPQRIINVHHSFLPAFSGSRPYHRAYERGVKLIGATSHYVTTALDEGPIIDQDVVRISHKDQLEGLIRKGRDLEKLVLARALRWHLEHRILVYANKCVVFV